jgi:hypothetical protein
MRPVGALHHARSALRGWGASSGWRIQQRALRSAPPTLFYARGTGSPHGARPALYEQQCFAPRWLVCSLYSDAGASVAVAASAAEAEANGAPEASEAAEEQDAQAHQLRQEQQQQWEAELEETLKLVHLLPESGARGGQEACTDYGYFGQKGEETDVRHMSSHVRADRCTSSCLAEGVCVQSGGSCGFESVGGWDHPGPAAAGSGFWPTHPHCATAQQRRA